ncbi:MFS transporter [Pelobacter seleniigenes]|uniref:MFS transporter n=1 Tax=Pelobacter seleniigenes TaxID=407188 RepID=UPI000690665F|nr:MFS transporter [Pelobacter seleniigenes]
MFAALKYRNYRLWFIGQLVSLVGTWMQTAAQGFLVFELTNSAAYLGYVAFAIGVPSFLLMFFGGVYADRLPRRKLIIITQIAMMILALVLACLTFLHIVQPWHIILLALMLGVATAFDAPARLSFVLELVDRKDIGNALAFNSMLFNLGVLIGPAAAGLVYVTLGPAWCFALNGLSFLAVIFALNAMHLRPFVPKENTSDPLDDLKAGFHYALSNEIIRTLLSLVAVFCLFGTVYMTLIPAWAVRVLGGDAVTNGWLLSARGLGALSGALMIAALGRFQLKGLLLTWGTFLFPLILLAFAFLRYLPMSLTLMVGIGWANMITFNLLNTLIQTLIADEYRGRVISLYTFCIFGLTPLGSLLIGWEAEYWGEPRALILNAMIVFLYALWVYVKVPQVRQQHERGERD